MIGSGSVSTTNISRFILEDHEVKNKNIWLFVGGMNLYELYHEICMLCFIEWK